MGKGDKKSAKGKRFKGSYGNSRKKASVKIKLKKLAAASKPAEVATAVAEEKPKAKRTVKKKTESAE